MYFGSARSTNPPLQSGCRSPCAQDDLLNSHLTVQETLAYTTRLRCPGTSEQRKQVGSPAAPPLPSHVKYQLLASICHNNRWACHGRVQPGQLWEELAHCCAAG